MEDSLPDVARGLSELRKGHLLTVKGVSRVLDVPDRRVYTLRDSGVLRGIKVGRSLRFAPSDVIALLEAGLDQDWPG